MYKAKQRMKTLLLACFAALVSMLLAVALWVAPTNKIDASAADTTIVFNLGANGSAAHKDGSTKQTTYKQTNGTYTLSLTDGDYMYPSSYDAKGNSCIKLGSSSKTGKFTFTVPEDVTSVIIAIGKYKANTSKVTINSTTHTLTKNSNDGAYDEITVDTSSTKTVSLTTVTGGVRAMVNTITFVIAGSEQECTHENKTLITTTPATCTVNGSYTYTCECGEEIIEEITATGHQEVLNEEASVAPTCTTPGKNVYTCSVCSNVKEEEIPVIDHTYVGGKCSVCGEVQPNEVTDVLNLGTTGVSGTNYSSWSDKTATSNAVYAGQSAGSYSSIQLRSNNNNSGIVTTASGGKVKKITIEWNANTDSARILDIYGKNTAYSQATDLYDTSKQGTKLGSIKCGTTELEIEGDYQYIGMRSNSGALYLTSITIVWEPAATCTHNNPTKIAAKNPTCTEAGNKEYWSCEECDKIFSDEDCTIETTLQNMEIGTLDHNFSEFLETVAPTTTTQGYDVYKCATCNETTKKNFVDATTDYTIDFGGVTENITAAANSVVTLPTLTTETTYVTFVGWTTTTFESGKVAPENILAAGSEYTLADNIAMYPVYSCVQGTNDYVKVTEAKTDWSGEYLIVYEDEDGNAYIFNAVDAVKGYVSATIVDGKIKNTDDVNANLVTIAAMSGGYSIHSTNGYIYGKSGSNELEFNTTTEQLNTIEFTDDGIQLISSTSRLRFNAASNQMRFRYYKAESYAAQKGIFLYENNSVTYYSSTESYFEANIDSASLTIGKDITMNYYVTMPDALAGAQMYFTVEGATSPIDPVNGKLVDGRYVFSLEIPPHFMANNISAELKLGDAVLAIKAAYSVKTYAENQLNKIADETLAAGSISEKNAKLKQLLTDLLYYGAAAQNYKDYNTENLATSGVENLGAASTATPDATDFTLTKNGEITSYPAYFQGAGVYFDNVNKIYVKLSTTENVTLKIGNVEVEITGTTIYTDGILATEFDETYTFELYHDGVLMQTLTYSVNAYAHAKQGDATMGELALALYRYGASATAYKA